MASIKDIIKSKFAGKEDFYYDRLSACLACEHWSANSGKSKGLLYDIANLGSDSCGICGCGESKLRLATEQCPASPPKWFAQQLTEPLKYEVENLSKDRVKKFYSALKKTVVLDYGQIPYNSDTQISIKINTPEDIKALHVTSSCGCTTPTPHKVEGGFQIDIKYDSQRKGYFSKDVQVKITESDNTQTTSVITITGTVK